MTPKIPNPEKILLVLKEMNTKVSSKDLAEFTGINVKNIGRYLTQLKAIKCISRTTKQVGKKRYNLNKILAKGKNYKFTATYLEMLTQIAEYELENEITTKNGIKKSIKSTETKEIIDTIQSNNLSYLESAVKNELKTELLGIIKVLAIRDVDAKKFNLKGKQQLTDLIISLILKL